MITRRGLIVNVLSIFCAPAIIRTPGLIMPINPFRDDYGNDFESFKCYFYKLSIIDLDWPYVVKICNIAEEQTMIKAIFNAPR